MDEHGLLSVSPFREARRKLSGEGLLPAPRALQESLAARRAAVAADSTASFLTGETYTAHSRVATKMVRILMGIAARNMEWNGALGDTSLGMPSRTSSLSSIPAALALISAVSIAPAIPLAADELYVDPRVSVPVTLTAAATVFGSELLKDRLAPRQCRWCDRDANGADDLNGLDRSVRDALRWSSAGAANTASSIVAFAAVPLAAVGLDVLAASEERRTEQVFEDVLVMAEATATAGVLTQVVKFSSGRERPFVHVLSNADRARTADPADNNTSFFSGHTAIAFALATSSGTVANFRGYRLAPLVWATGLTLATATAYLRIAADKHYFTDVAAAAGVGAIVGWAMPRLFHTRHGPAVSLTVGGAPGLSLTWNTP